MMLYYRMPRQCKNDMYKKEQDEIINRVLEILELDEDNSFTLYELDHNQEKQDAIMNLLEDVRKYFSFGNYSFMARPHIIKKKYLSLVKNVLKQRYVIKPVRYQYDNIKTIKYIIEKCVSRDSEKTQE